MTTRRLVLPALCLSLSFSLLTACKKSGSSTPGAPKIGLIMKSLSNDFFSNMAEGAKQHQAANATKYELVVNGIKNETDLAEQVNLVEQMVAQGVKAIVIAPADSKALVPALKKAKDAGVLVINIDNRLDTAAAQQAGLQAPFVGPDNRAGARKVGEHLAKQLKAGDQVAIIEGVVTAFNSQQRREGLEESMKAAGMNVVSTQSGQWETEKANAVASALLTSHPDLKAILCANDSMTLGAVAAVTAAGKSGAVKVTGFDNISAVQPMLADGRVVATADQHGDKLAVYGIEAALEAISTGKIPSDQQTPVDLITK
jgi:ribose transport system substrate-binding protein